MIYLILKLFSITSRRLKQNVKNPDKLTTFDYYFVKLVDSFSSILILSGIYDFTLYCSHEILHHDINIDQTSQTNVSYYQSVLCLTLVLIEIISMFEGLRKLNLNKITNYETKVNEIKEYIVDKSKSHTNRLNAKSRLMYYKRRYEYDLGAMILFFTKGIKVQHLKKWTGRYYRFALIMKLVLFEIMIVSLQMMPKTQLMLMTIL